MLAENGWLSGCVVQMYSDTVVSFIMILKKPSLSSSCQSSVFAVFVYLVYDYHFSYCCRYESSGLP